MIRSLPLGMSLIMSIALSAPAQTPDQDMRERLGEIERKLDRVETLLRMLFADRLRRVERLMADEPLTQAIAALEERYGIRNAAEALTSDGPERLLELRRTLLRASSAAGPSAFASDPAVAEVVAAMAERADYMAERRGKALESLAGADREAAGRLAAAVLARGTRGAAEAALWEAVTARGLDLQIALNTFARESPPTEPVLAALLSAAMAAQGDEAAEERLAAMVTGGEAPSDLAFRIAGELERSGSPSAYSVYLALVADPAYAFASAQAFGRIEGYDRRIVWRDVRERPQALSDELAAWLAAHRQAIAYDNARSRFFIK